MWINAEDNKIVEEVKNTDSEAGVACFYLNYDALNSKKRIITYFIETNLVKKQKLENA